MARSKAEFRALRELTGITQAQLAKLLHVEVRSVKRWESESAPQNAPADAWDIIDAAVESQRRAVEIALDRIDAMEDESGAPPEAVMLPYWSSAEEYAGHSTDAALGVETDSDSWRMANASNRALAAVLMAEGVPVVWKSGKDNPARPPV